MSVQESQPQMKGLFESQQKHIIEYAGFWEVAQDISQNEEEMIVDETEMPYNHMIRHWKWEDTVPYQMSKAG